MRRTLVATLSFALMSGSGVVSDAKKLAIRSSETRYAVLTRPGFGRRLAIITENSPVGVSAASPVGDSVLTPALCPEVPETLRECASQPRSSCEGTIARRRPPGHPLTCHDPRDFLRTR